MRDFHIHGKHMGIIRKIVFCLSKNHVKEKGRRSKFAQLNYGKIVHAYYMRPRLGRPTRRIW